MKKISRALTVLLAAALLCASLAACGETPKAAGLSKAFTGGAASYLEAIGWYASDVYTLKVNSDSTYELTYQEHIFGTTDPGIKGLRTIVYTGTCTSAPSADGWETHVDYTLNPATRIYFEQHEKGYGRAAIAGHVILDSANWTEAMTEAYDPENAAKGAAEFLSENAQTLTVTVEDPSLDPEDVSLGCRIVELPVLTLVG